MSGRKLSALIVAIPLVAVAQWLVPQATAQQATSGDVPSPLTAAQAQSLSTNVTSRVIVVFKNQVPADPPSRSDIGARRSAEATDQQPVLSELSQTNARDVHTYTTINAVAATVSPGEQARLAADPTVAEVIPDQIINMAPPTTTNGPSGPATRTPVAGTCSTDPNNPELAPQALSLINADSSVPGAKTARSLGIDGSGVTVAYIADGVDINNPDFQRDGKSVFTDYEDFTGTGTSAPTGGGEAFIDSSSIAAQGSQSYDISNYGALPLSEPCYVKVEGVAPGANLVGLIAFTGESGFNSTILQAIDYATLTVDHVNVLNESFGANLFPDDTASFDLIKQADDQATAAGTTVTVSSGDAGVTNTTGSPSDDPERHRRRGDDLLRAGFPGRLRRVPVPRSHRLPQRQHQLFQLERLHADRHGPVGCRPGRAELGAVHPESGALLRVLELQRRGEPDPRRWGHERIRSADRGRGGTGDPGLREDARRQSPVARPGEGVHPAPAPQTTSTPPVTSRAAASDPDAYRAVLAAEDNQATPPAGSENIILKGTEQFNAVAGTRTPESFTEQLTNLGPTAQTVEHRGAGRWGPTRR